jgi:hypothetical protein
MLVSQHNIKVVPKIFGYNLFILEKSILYITGTKRGRPVGWLSDDKHGIFMGIPAGHWILDG